MCPLNVYIRVSFMYKESVMRSVIACFVLALCLSISLDAQIIIDHHCTNLSLVPENAILAAKQRFRLSYGHTSHGSQIVSGMQLLNDLPSSMYTYTREGTAGSLSLYDTTPGGDLGHAGDLTWEEATRQMLEQPSCNRNVVMWSWCGGCSDNTEQGIAMYLNAMEALERDYPDVTFIYMTGHLDGSGAAGNLHQRNEQIREWCRSRGKVLFDFADIESFDPDGNAFLQRFADDGCNYIGSDGQQHNWADEWCERNPGACSDCSCAHSHCLNCQQKGKAFWWMMARLAGWQGVTPNEALATPGESPMLHPLFPNPASDEVHLCFDLPEATSVRIRMLDLAGRIVAEVSEHQVYSSGTHTLAIPAASLAQGAYMVELRTARHVSLQYVLLHR